MSKSKHPSYLGGHTVWKAKDLLTEKHKARDAAYKAALKVARKTTKAARDARQRAAERANDRLADAAGRALLQAEAVKPTGPRLELRHVTEPDGRKTTVRVWR